MDKHLRDPEAERLFAGGNAPDPEQPLTRFGRDVRATFSSPPSAPTRAVHLQAMAATREGLLTAQAPAAVARAPRRRRFVVRGSIAAAALVLVGGSAMAATGTLPDAAQDAVSRVARRLGVKIPAAKPADVQRVDPDVLDVDRPVVEVEVADDKPAADRDRDDDRDDSDDDGSVSSFTNSDRDTRRNRRDNDGPTTVVPATPDEPSSGDGSDDGSGAIDDSRGDPSGDSGDGDGGTDPDDGSDPGTDDGTDDDGGSRGDPKDGSGSDESADDGTGATDGGAGQS